MKKTESAAAHRFRRLATAGVLVLLGLLIMPGIGNPQTLAVQGDHFTVDGVPKFLVFVSYFDGLRASDSILDADFSYFQSTHIDGVRVLASWNGNSLIDAKGNIVSTVDARLTSLLAKASQHGLLVDLTFAWGQIPGGSVGAGQLGIKNVASSRFGQYRNLLFDLENEYNLHSLDRDQIKTLRDQVKDIDTKRILVASTSFVSDSQASNDAEYAMLDATAHHESRNSNWFNETSDHVATLRASGRPVFLDEPCRDMAPSCPTATASQYMTAVNAAKTAGAAAWTYHNAHNVSQDLSSASFQSRQRQVDIDFLGGFSSQLPGS